MVQLPLVKQIVKELNKSNEYAIVVVSLFGIDSVTALNHRIREEYLSINKPFVAKAKKFIKPIGNVAKDGLDVASIAVPGLVGLSAASQGLSALLSYDVLDEFKVKNTVGKNKCFSLVFDDLERSNIPPKELLGAMNEYIENRMIKVIVIADEEKMSGDEYKEYKEKLISRTICMATDYSALVENIVTHYAETSSGYREFLCCNLDLLKILFFESQTFNIRIFKYILADFERAYSAWIESDVSTENMAWALYTFGAEVYLSKVAQPNSSSNEQNSSVPDKQEEQYQYKGRYNSSFGTLNKWIRQGFWNGERFIEELKQKYTVKIESPLYRFLTYRFWDLQQQDIDAGLPEAVNLAYKGGLTKDEMICLIGQIHFLRIAGIEISVNIDYHKMEAGFEKRFIMIQKGIVVEPQSYRTIDKDNVDDEAIPLHEELERFDDRLVAYSNRRRFIDFLSGDDSVTLTSIQGICLEEFDDDLLLIFFSKYSTSDNSVKRAIARLLGRFTYNCPEYSKRENILTTITNFKKLISLLKKHNETDSIAKLIAASFLKDLEEKIEILQKGLNGGEEDCQN